MEHGYRLVFSGGTIYNEIDIPNGSEIIGIGTISGCKARFSKSIFDQDFLITVNSDVSKWNLECKNGVYFMEEGRKTSEICVQEGDYTSVYSSSSDNELFKITCLINYDEEAKTFDSRIDLKGKQQIIAGNTNDCDLFLKNIGESDEAFKIENAGDYLRVSVIDSSLGVYVNGNRIIGITRVNEHDFFSCGPYSFYFSEPYLYITDFEGIQDRNLKIEKVIESTSALKYPKFNRNTQVKSVLSKEPITVLDPPEIPQKPSDGLLMTLFPALITLGLSLVIGYATGMAGIGATMVIGVVTSIFSYTKSRKNYKDSLQNRISTYNAYIARKKEEIESARDEERKLLMEKYPDATETIDRVKNFRGDLFDRTLNDDDFLHIRVGLGQRKALREIAYKPKDSLVLGDEVQMMPEELAKEFEYLQQAPLIVDLKQAGILGVIGNENSSHSFLNAIIEDLCCRQFFDDASMYMICNEEQFKKIEWIRFMPHFQSEKGTSRNIAYDKESCDKQFEFLFKTLSIRENVSSKYSDFPAIIVFVLDQMGLYTHPVSKYLKQAKDLGVYFVFVTKNREDLPLYCGNLVVLNENDTASLIDVSNQDNITEFKYENLSDEIMQEVAIKLAPVYCEDVSVESNLPKNFTLFSLLGIQGADDLDLNSRWKKTDITKSMAAPLGLKNGGEVISLDLHEKYHGPHGLVAGTTGSGKSELLQSYILSMATLYAPDEVGFVIIDFKGGGMANLLSDLPHLIGTITDIDGKSINRSLMSIRAEIDKRKRVFADTGVNNINDYIRKYKSADKKSMVPLPHLVLIIDEFAELKADQPEFMKEVVSAARVGRSLGIHLILATQKPAGVVDDQIWSNSRFKLCLKVQNKNDSNEVLKSPLAAEIREPGRAYLQVGNNEIFELFQSAYSGAPAQSEEMDHVNAFELYEIDNCGRKKKIFAQKESERSDSGESTKTQLRAITEKIAQYCHEMKIEKIDNICLPPLPMIIDFPETSGFVKDGYSTRAEVGYYDDPANQAQNKVEIDLSMNNTLVIGASQSGKTNLLMTMIRSLATRYSPNELNMYIIDFGPSILSNYLNLPHVGGVVNDTEDEELKNLFKLLNTEIILRKRKMAEAKVSSLSAYRKAGYIDLPMIVLFVDNFTALKELYFANDDFLLPICRNGLSVGISVVIANQNMQGISYKYSSSFSERIAFHCNDSSDYTTIIDHCRLYPDNLPGRAVTIIDKTIYEMQVYSSFTGEHEKEKVGEQNLFIERCIEKYKNQRAKIIPMIPDRLSMRYLCDNYPECNQNDYKVTIGLDYNEILPVTYDLTSIGSFGIVGKMRKESQLVMDSILDQLNRKRIHSEVDVYLFDSMKRELLKYKNLPIIKEYSSDGQDIVSVINQVHEEAVKRFNECIEYGNDALDLKKQIVIIINGNDLADVFCKERQALSNYKEILDRYSDMKICFIYLNVSNDEAYSVPEAIKQLKDSKNILYFDSLSKFKFFHMASSSSLRSISKLQTNDGYFFNEGEPIRFKILTE